MEIRTENYFIRSAPDSFRLGSFHEKEDPRSPLQADPAAKEEKPPMKLGFSSLKAKP